MEHKLSKDSIPVDLLIDIFSRVPAKSIARFRCVSKLWASILLRTDFTELFLTKSWTRPRILFTFTFNEKVFFFSSLQPQNPDENSPSLVATRYKSFRKNAPPYICPPICGLVCVHTWEGKALGISNPVTGKIITLPKVKEKGLGASYFGFDPVNKQFKVLYMKCSSTLRVLTLESTGKYSWRRIQCPIPHHFHGLSGVCINGVLYYTAVSGVYPTYIIVAFDVRLEKFDVIYTNQEMFVGSLSPSTLLNYKGKLGLLHRRREEGLVLLVLDDAREHKWSRIICVVPPHFRNEVLFIYKTVVNNSVGEIVFSQPYLKNPFGLLYYNIERKTFTRVAVYGFESFNHHAIRVDTSLDFVENMNF